MAIRLTSGEFDKVVENAVAAIPARFRARMVNLVLRVEAHPPSPDLLGLFEGQDGLGEALFAGPDRITIYQRPHEEMALNRQDLQRIVNDTVWHEVGHYFGMSERQVHAVEARRERLRRLRPGFKRT